MTLRSRLRTVRTSLLLVLATCCWLPGSQSSAQTLAQAPEAELKAAIIANMLMFVEWPDARLSALDQISICYLDASPVAGALTQLDGKSVKGKRIKVSQISPERTSECQALYLSPNNTGQLTRMVQQSKEAAPILLFSDTQDFLQRGVMVNLEQVGGRLVFDINLRALNTAGLKLSSKALRLARVVVE